MPRRLGCARKVRVNYGLPRGALNSAVECHLHTVEVAGSNPAAPTINQHKSQYIRDSPVRVDRIRFKELASQPPRLKKYMWTWCKGSKRDMKTE